MFMDGGPSDPDRSRRAAGARAAAILRQGSGRVSLADDINDDPLDLDLDMDDSLLSLGFNTGERSPFSFFCFLGSVYPLWCSRSWWGPVQQLQPPHCCFSFPCRRRRCCSLAGCPHHEAIVESGCTAAGCTAAGCTAAGSQW